MQMFVCLSVCPLKVCLELSIFIFLTQVSVRTLSGHSQVSYQLFFTAILAYLIEQTEPKILCLVIIGVISPFISLLQFINSYPNLLSLIGPNFTATNFYFIFQENLEEQIQMMKF